MSPRKLSEGDRTEILDLYRNTDATSSTLADRYGVSNSTVSRFLKMSLSQQEYDSLIQQKRLARSNSKKKKKNQTKSESPEKPTTKKSQPSITEEKVKESENIEENPPQEIFIPTADNSSKKELENIEENLPQETPTSIAENFPNEKVEKPILKIKKAPDLEEIVEDEEEYDSKDLESVNTAQEMFGEEIVEDEEDEEDEEDVTSVNTIKYFYSL